VSDLVERLRAACNGHPHAKIAWPHRILHEAADRIEALERERAALRDERDSLIAAAPAQLAALKNAIETHHSGSGRWLQTAYEAIAKAEPPNPPGTP